MVWRFVSKEVEKEFFLNKDNLSLAVGDVVAVEGNPGHDIGVVSLVGELVQYKCSENKKTQTFRVKKDI